MIKAALLACPDGRTHHHAMDVTRLFSARWRAEGPRSRVTPKEGHFLMRRGALLAFLTTVVITLWADLAFSQPVDELNALKGDIEALKEGQTAAQRDLEEIRSLLEARPTAAAPAPEEVVLNLDGAPVKGDRKAAVTLVDFTDYQ